MGGFSENVSNVLFSFFFIGTASWTLLENDNSTASQSHETEGIIFDEEPSHVTSCETEGIDNVEELSHMTFTAPQEGTEDPFWESEDLSFYGVPADLPTCRPAD